MSDPIELVYGEIVYERDDPSNPAHSDTTRRLLEAEKAERDARRKWQQAKRRVRKWEERAKQEWKEERAR